MLLSQLLHHPSKVTQVMHQFFDTGLEDRQGHGGKSVPADAYEASEIDSENFSGICTYCIPQYTAAGLILDILRRQRHVKGQKEQQRFVAQPPA